MTFENLNLAFISLLITLSILFFAHYRGRYNKVFGADNFNPKLLTPMNKYLFNVEKYNSAKSELLIINAVIAANNRTRPLAASSLKNHLKGLDK